MLLLLLLLSSKWYLTCTVFTVCSRLITQKHLKHEWYKRNTAHLSRSLVRISRSRCLYYNESCKLLCCDVINYWIRSNKDFVRKKMPSKEMLYVYRNRRQEKIYERWLLDKVRNYVTYILRVWWMCMNIQIYIFLSYIKRFDFSLKVLEYFEDDIHIAWNKIVNILWEKALEQLQKRSDDSFKLHFMPLFLLLL